MVPGEESLGARQSKDRVTYSIHPDAEDELADAAVYYATHASSLIAAAFLAEYERVRDLIVENQQRGPAR